MRLGGDDSLFRDVRHCHVSQLGPLLHRRTLKMQEIEAEKDSIQTVQDMQGFMVLGSIRLDLDTSLDAISRLLLTQPFIPRE